MSIMGYDPAVYHTGRSPLEAAEYGVDLGPTTSPFAVIGDARRLGQ